MHRKNLHCVRNRLHRPHTKNEQALAWCKPLSCNDSAEKQTSNPELKPTFAWENVLSIFRPTNAKGVRPGIIRFVITVDFVGHLQVLGPDWCGDNSSRMAVYRLPVLSAASECYFNDSAKFLLDETGFRVDGLMQRK